MKRTLGNLIKLNQVLDSVRATGLVFKNARLFIKNKRILVKAIEVDVDAIEALRVAFFSRWKGKLKGIHLNAVEDIPKKDKPTHYEWVEDQRQLQIEVDEELKKEIDVDFEEKVNLEKFITCTIAPDNKPMLEALGADDLNLLIELFLTED